MTTIEGIIGSTVGAFGDLQFTATVSRVFLPPTTISKVQIPPQVVLSNVKLPAFTSRTDITYPLEITVTSSEVGPQGIQGPQGSFSDADKKALELELEYKTTSPSYFKELTYVSGSLTNISIWAPSKITKLFNKALTYASGQLSQSILTRITDGATLTKDFTYSSGQLISVDVTAS